MNHRPNPLHIIFNNIPYEIVYTVKFPGTVIQFKLTLIIMPEVNGESGVKIRYEQWTVFWSWVEGYTPSASEKERLFIERWLQNMTVNEHWLWVFRNVLAEALALNALGKTINNSSIFQYLKNNIFLGDVERLNSFDVPHRRRILELAIEEAKTEYTIIKEGLLATNENVKNINFLKNIY